MVLAGCAVHAMQMAVLSQGFNGIWRTGVWTAQPEDVCATFACRQQDDIVGFLYLGTPPLKASSTVLPPAIDAFVRRF